MRPARWPSARAPRPSPRRVRGSPGVTRAQVIVVSGCRAAMSNVVRDRDRGCERHQPHFASTDQERKSPDTSRLGEVRNMSGPIVGVGELREQRYGVRPEKRLKKVEKCSLLPLRADRILVGRFVMDLLQCKVIDRSGVPVLAAPADTVARLLVEISHIGRDRSAAVTSDRFSPPLNSPSATGFSPMRPNAADERDRLAGGPVARRTASRRRRGRRTLPGPGAGRPFDPCAGGDPRAV